MAIQKREYELSVWNEELVDGIKKESRGVTIGSHDMTYPGRATSVKLVRSIKGTNTLTFQMPTKYFDSEKGEYVKNELIEDLYNERKLKLKYKDKWYEFYIKKITENKQYKSIMKQFECTDSFIDELSRTGYEVEFAPELNNSVEEIGVFMETPEGEKISGSSKAILDGSVWDYHPEMNTGDFTEYNEMRFYKIPLSQFGGSIQGYPIDLEVNNSDFKEGTEEEKEERATLTNPFTNEKRALEYGDDQARVEELFWDPYYQDNGRNLLDDNNLVTLTGGYIYVPITDLSFIQGSIYSNSTKAIEEPALYGTYGRGSTKYALQPYSENPMDLIQFIYFDENSVVNIDENGIVANNDYHYVIKIKQWNDLLAKQLENSKDDNGDTGLIYWTSPNYDGDTTYTLTTKYNTKVDGEIRYSTNVRPNTRTIDDFSWYPVYYEGYLDTIEDTEVSMARKLSVTDRTELNLNDDIYVTVYNNKASDYKELYSDEDVYADDKNNFKDYRVTSKTESRIVLPTLARNLAENASSITDTNGWEAMTQNYNDEDLGVGSYKKVLELSVQSTVNNNDTNLTITTLSDTTGAAADEQISDYYLEILSPCIDKSEDLTYEGEVCTDYALNFGITGQEKKIEKDKVYAIRMVTGKWVVDNYTFYLRSGEDSNLENQTFSEEEKIEYEQSIKDFKDLIISLENSNFNNSKYQEVFKNLNSIELPSDNDTNTSDKYIEISETLGSILSNIISIHDTSISKSYLKWENLISQPDFSGLTTSTEINNTANTSDLKYLKYALFSLKNKIDSISTSTSTFYYATRITSKIVEDWINNEIIENSHFEKGYNLDLDKIIIGEGSTNLKGNYLVDGTEDRVGDNYKYISFSQLADLDNLKLLKFVPCRGATSQPDYKYLNSPLYYTKDTKAELTNRWSWKEEKDNISIEDNSFVLFKAKQTIENPYIAIQVDSEPAEINFDSIQQKSYIENNGSGVRIEVIVPGEDITITADLDKLIKDGYEYVNNCLVEVYSISSTSDNSYNCFSQDFCDSVGFNKDNGTIGIVKNNTVSGRAYGELKDGDLNPNSPWKGYSSTSAPLYDTAIAGETTTADKSFGYALFINGVYYGVFWFEKNK